MECCSPNLKIASTSTFYEKDYNNGNNSMNSNIDIFIVFWGGDAYLKIVHSSCLKSLKQSFIYYAKNYKREQHGQCNHGRS